MPPIEPPQWQPIVSQLKLLALLGPAKPNEASAFLAFLRLPPSLALARSLAPNTNTGARPTTLGAEQIWTKYDTDSSGCIDADELRNFLRDLIATNLAAQGGQAAAAKLRKSTSVEEDKLDEYTETLLKIFDANKDGKLQLSEMTK